MTAPSDPETAMTTVEFMPESTQTDPKTVTPAMAPPPKKATSVFVSMWFYLAIRGYFKRLNKLCGISALRVQCSVVLESPPDIFGVNVNVVPKSIEAAIAFTEYPAHFMAS